jgi:hypothetical protein
MQLLAGRGAVASDHSAAVCRTARGQALLPLGLLALKLRGAYVDAVYEAVHGRKRPVKRSCRGLHEEVVHRGGFKRGVPPNNTKNDY